MRQIRIDNRFKEYTKKFNIQNISCDYQPSWNIAPSQSVPVVICHNGINQLVCYRWGLIPSWSRDPSIAEKLINARAETVDKPRLRNRELGRERNGHGEL